MPASLPFDNLPLLLEPQHVKPLLEQPQSSSGKLLIIDLSSKENYLKHHLPGAVHIEPKNLQCGVPPSAGKLPSVDQLNALFSAVGLTEDSYVIAYDDEGGGWAGRLIWTLDVIGHKHYSYIDGGIHSWIAEGYDVQSGDTVNINKTHSHYTVSLSKQPIAAMDDIIANLDNPSYAIWDARSAEEYSGKKMLAKRGGHIPGAININWLDLIDKQRDRRLIDLQHLQNTLNTLGLSKDKTIVTHCQTHHRSGLSYLLMKILGYPDIKAYDGSWSEWGNNDNTPIHTESDNSI